MKVANFKVNTFKLVNDPCSRDPCGSVCHVLSSIAFNLEHTAVVKRFHGRKIAF